MPYRSSRRLGGDEAVFSISNFGISNRVVFRNHLDHRRFVTTLAKLARQTTGLSIIAYVLTATSFNLVVHEHERDNLSKFMHKLSVSYAMYFQNKYQSTGKIFQGPFKDTVLDSDDEIMLEICRLHLLPDGFGFDPERYDWSSYGKYLNNRAPWLKKDFVIHYLKTNNIAYDLRYFTQFSTKST
ncbi:MAG: hypothetical protein AAB459_03240 [Patescibacteria group bacterium]